MIEEESSQGSSASSIHNATKAEVAAGILGQAVRWESFARRNARIVPPDPLHTPDSYPEATEEGQLIPPQTYCLRVDSVIGAVVPLLLFQAFSEVSAAFEHRFRVTWYDPATQQFFGSTYISPSVQPDPPETDVPVNALNASNQGLELDEASPQTRKQSAKFDFPVYTKTRFKDPRLILVVELAVGLRLDGVLHRETSTGFCLIRPFASGTERLVDTSQGPQSAQVNVYAGSPRLLALINPSPGVSLESTLLPLHGAVLSYTFGTHASLQTAAHLIREHSLVGLNDLVPGVRWSTYWGDLDDAPEDGPEDPLANPDLLPAFPLNIGSLELALPDGFEASLVRALESTRADQEAATLQRIDDPSDRPISILARRISVGVHNGRTYVAEPAWAHLNLAPNGHLIFGGSLSFPDVLAAHPMVAVVFFLEYTVTWRLPSEAHADANAPVSTEQTVQLGWAPYFPFDGFRAPSGLFRVMMAVGPGFSPQGSPLFDGLFDTQPTLQFRIFNPDLPQATRLRLPPGTYVSGYSDASSVSSGSSFRSEPATPPRVPEAPSPASNRAPGPGTAPPLGAHNKGSPVAKRPQWPSNVARGEMADLPAAGMGKKVAPVEIATVNLSKADRARALATGGYLDRVGNLDLGLELIPPNAGNNIQILFLGFTRTGAEGVTGDGGFRAPGSLYFSTRFYRFPHIQTERLFVRPMDGGGNNNSSSKVNNTRRYGLVRANAGDATLSGDGTMAVLFRCDPQVMGVGEPALWAQYMAHSTLYIDVWDGDRLSLVGSAAVPLKFLLRQGSPNVTVTDAFDIVDYSGAQMTGQGARRGAGGSALLPTAASVGGWAGHSRGKLHLRLSNDGFAAEPFPDPGKVPERAGANGEPQSVVGRRIEQVWPESASGLPQGALTGQAGSKAREDAHVALVQYRARMRDSVLSSLLTTSLRSPYRIEPCYGVAEYFEVPFVNPYSEAHTFTVDLAADSELSLVTEVQEWRRWKKWKGLTTPVEDGMFGDGRRLYLAAGERVMVPFKFQSWAHGPVRDGRWSRPDGTLAPSNGLGGPRVDGGDLALPIRSRSIALSFLNRHGVLVRGVDVTVAPKPPVVHQVLRLWAPEHEYLKTSLLLVDQDEMVASGGAVVPSNTYKWIRCDALDGEDVLVSSSPPPADGSTSLRGTSGQSIQLKYRAKAAPDVAVFYVSLYHDEWFVGHWQTWEVVVSSLARLDVRAQIGSVHRSSLVLKGADVSRRVRAWSSVPGELGVTPQDPFVLVAGALNEVVLTYAPRAEGESRYTVSVVDEDSGNLVSAWVIAGTGEAPVITKSFELTIAPNRVVKKKISYSNPLTKARSFLLRTSRPDLVKFRESKMDIPGNGARFIQMQFNVVPFAGSKEVLVFINDVEGRTDECLAIQLSCQLPPAT